ncbi:MAG: sigma-70 family RNA polymerase sigma factor [Clostridium sporogenes]|nr:sigma-70 family RNA polymerase sigma factor [Clostridium sporogenes]
MIHIDNYKKTEYMLYNYKQFKVEIKNILLEIEDIENSYRGIGAMCYEEKSAPTNKISSSVEQEVEQKEKRIEHLNRLISKKENIIKRIDNALEVLTNYEHKLIELRYFKNLTHFKVAEILEVDVSTIYRNKKEIINKLSSVMFVV